MTGPDAIRSWAPQFPNQYALIGGEAGRLMLDRAGLPPRLSDHRPIVLSTRVVSEDFASRVRSLVREGRYRKGRAGDADGAYIHFIEPKASSFPPLLEVVTDTAGALMREACGDNDPAVIPPASAVPSGPLMDEPTFAVLGTWLKQVEGPPLLDERHLIPVKARAWMDLADRRISGQPMDRDVVRKPLREVFQLLTLLRRTEQILVPPEAQNDLVDFIVRQQCSPSFDPQAEGLDLSLAEALHLLSELYGLDIAA